MTTPTPQPMALAAATEVRQDPDGNAIVVLRLGCGPAMSEFFIAPGDAERFGQGLANALRIAGEQAATLQPSIVVPPKGLFIPNANGSRR